ncbi:hypothetical protein BH23ACT9_BH23ACT9_34230 [soil metagenome]
MDDTLREGIRERLDRFDIVEHPAGDLRRAAVCLALVADEQGGAGVVLCRRGRVGSHQGQWGLPGGRIDADEDAQTAALRELAEEVGLVGGQVLGRLDDYPTRSGFHISPFVVWCPDARPAVTSPAEIRSVHHIDLGELVRPDSPRWIDIPESDRAVLQLPIGDQLIHAPTAAVLYQFAEVALRGRHTRVLDVEEPVFAWR